MVVTDCNFDPSRDLKAVEPFGFVDLKESFVNNCVPSNSPDSDSDYNGIQDPASILGMPSDVFDALRYDSDLKSDSDEKKDSD